MKFQKIITTAILLLYSSVVSAATNCNSIIVRQNPNDYTDCVCENINFGVVSLILSLVGCLTVIT